MGLPSARARGQLHVDAELGVEAALHERELGEHHRGGPGLEAGERQLGYVDGFGQLDDARVAVFAHHLLERLRRRQRALLGHELHGLEGIQVVEIDFHDDGVGGLVGVLELR